MAGLARYTQTTFGTSAGANTMGNFGGYAAAQTIAPDSGSTITPAIVQALSAWAEGWFGAIVGDGNPTVEDTNSAFYLFAYQLSYLLTRGVPAWDSGTGYNTGDIVQSGGVLYRSLVDANTNNAVTVSSNWTSIDGKVQTISTNTSVVAGNKLTLITAGAAATLPDATTVLGQEFEFVNSDGNSGNVVKTVSSQTISGQNATSSPYALSQQYQFIKVRSDGSNYWIVSAG